MAQEFAPADPTVDQTVDQMGFERIATVPDGVDNLKSLDICSCSGSAASATLTGSTAAAGTCCPIRRVPPVAARDRPDQPTPCRAT